MATATVAFRKCVIKSPEVEGDENHLASRIYFDLDIDEEGHANAYVDVRMSLVHGLEDQPLEISAIYGYEGPLNYEVFRGSVEFYFRQATGGKGSIFTTGGKFLPLTDWIIEQEMLVQFEIVKD